MDAQSSKVSLESSSSMQENIATSTGMESASSIEKGPVEIPAAVDVPSPSAPSAEVASTSGSDMIAGPVQAIVPDAEMGMQQPVYYYVPVTPEYAPVSYTPYNGEPLPPTSYLPPMEGGIPFYPPAYYQQPPPFFPYPHGTFMPPMYYPPQPDMNVPYMNGPPLSLEGNMVEGMADLHISKPRRRFNGDPKQRRFRGETWEEIERRLPPHIGPVPNVIPKPWTHYATPPHGMPTYPRPPFGDQGQPREFGQPAQVPFPLPNRPRYPPFQGNHAFRPGKAQDVNDARNFVNRQRPRANVNAPVNRRLPFRPMLPGKPSTSTGPATNVAVSAGPAITVAASTGPATNVTTSEGPATNPLANAEESTVNSAVSSSGASTESSIDGNTETASMAAAAGEPARPSSPPIDFIQEDLCHHQSNKDNDTAELKKIINRLCNEH